MSSNKYDEMFEAVTHAARENETAVFRFDEVAYGKLGVNRTDGRCLDVLSIEGPVTAGRLAEVTGLTTAAVTAVIDRLERLGYARRTRDPSDRRKVIVEVTETLTRKAEQIWGPLAEEAKVAIRTMSIRDLEVVQRFFEEGKALNERHVDRVRALELD